MEILYLIVENNISKNVILGAGLVASCFVIFLLPLSRKSTENSNGLSEEEPADKPDSTKLGNDSVNTTESEVAFERASTVDSITGAQLVTSAESVEPACSQTNKILQQEQVEEPDSSIPSTNSISTEQPSQSVMVDHPTDQVVQKKFSWAEKGKDRLMEGEEPDQENNPPICSSLPDSEKEDNSESDSESSNYVEKKGQNEEHYVPQTTLEDYILDDEGSSGVVDTDINWLTTLWGFLSGILEFLFN